jgi:hypothetical protein
MTSVSPTMRMAAVRLQVLARADQEWLLGQLDPDSASRLRGLLADLKQTGIAFDAHTVAQLTQDEATAMQVQARREFESEHAQRCARASSAQVVAALTAEPDVLVRALLDVAPWPWRDAVREVRKFDRPISVGATPVTLGPQAADALVELLAQRLDQDLAAEPRREPAIYRPPAAPTDRVAGLLDRVRQWMR